MLRKMNAVTAAILVAAALCIFAVFTPVKFQREGQGGDSPVHGKGLPCSHRRDSYA